MDILGVLPKEFKLLERRKILSFTMCNFKFYANFIADFCGIQLNH